MSEITRNQAIQIVEDIRTAISAGSVTNTMEAQVLEYCVSVLGRRIVEASLSGHIENLPDVAAFLAGISPSATLKALLEGITDAVEVINANIGNGYVYAGIATPSGTPVSGKVFYLAKQAGQYANFGGLTVTEGVNILKRNGSTWTQEQLMSMADIYKNPLIGYYECDTAGDTSAKTVTAAGYVLPATGGSVKIKMANRNTVANATLNINSTGAKPLYYNGQRAGVGNTWDTNEIIEVFYDGAKYQAYNVAGSNGDGVFDISAYNLTNGQPTPYEDLEAALGPNGEHVPQSLRKGGMSVKFIQSSAYSSDNKYVQYRLMSNTFNTTETDWQGVDEGIITGSQNLAESGSVDRALYKNAYKVPITSWRDVPLLDSSYYLTPTGGKTSNQSWSISDYINVSEGDVFNYKLTGYNSLVALYALYDKHKKIVSSYTGSSSQQTGSVTIPSDIYFIRFCGQFEETKTDTYDSNNVAIYPKDINTKISEIETYIDDVDDYSRENKSEIVQLTRKTTSFHKTFGSESVVSNKLLYADGSVNTYSGYSTSDFINIEKASKIIYKNLFRGSSSYSGICLYNEEKNIPCIASLRGYGVIDLAEEQYSECRYIRFCCTLSSVPSVELVNNTDIDVLQIQMSKTPVLKYDNIVDSSINFIDATLPSNYRVTDYIEVEGGETYKFYGACIVKEYDINKTIIDTYNFGSFPHRFYKLNSNTKFIVVAWNINSFQNICVQRGIFVGSPTPYGYYYEDVVPDEFIRDTNNIVGNAESKYAIGYQINTSNGELSAYSNAGARAWDFIEVEPSKDYKCKFDTSYNAAIAASYDENQDFLGMLSLNTTTGRFTTTADTIYIRVSSVSSATKLSICEWNENFDIPQDYNRFDLSPDINLKPHILPTVLRDKIWNVMGDSISDSGTGATSAEKYYSLISSKYGTKNRNYGVGSTCIAKRNSESTNDMCIRYANMADNADYITVFGGTNDFGNHIPIGEWGDSVNTTLYGAMKILCEGLINKYMGKKIGFILPLPRYSNEIDYSWPTSGLKEYVECIKDVCKRYSIPTLDLYTESGISVGMSSVRTAMIPDGLHPNATGHALIAEKIAQFLLSL